MSDFQTIHRMVWIANNATARKSPGRTAVAGNRLPPVDLLFEHPPDVQNGEIRHRISTPLRVQEAGTSPSNEIKRIGACLSVLFGLGEKIRTSGLGADFPSHTLGRPPVDLLFDRSPDGRNDALRHRKSTPLRVQEAGTSPSNEIKRIGACLSVLFGLGEKIRTSGLLNPIQARYQTALHPVA